MSISKVDFSLLGLEQLGLPFDFRSRVDWWTAIIDPSQYGNKVTPSRIY